MYVITNHSVSETASGPANFGRAPNENGNNELRLAGRGRVRQ